MKDSLQEINPGWAKRKSEQVSAKAARKAAAKKRKETEEDVNQAAARVVREATKD